jgi:hypothetical protein
MTAADIVGQVRISDIWRELDGGALRPAGQGKYRGQAFWRDGDGWCIAVDDARGTWFDHRDAIGGGVLDLVAHVRGGDRQDALKWLAALAGVALDDRPLCQADRAAWARERRLWPERKFISAAVEINHDDDVFREFFSRIAQLATRRSTGKAVADIDARAIEPTEVRVEVLGPEKPTGA